jgi:hypothetical protein
MGVVKDLRDRRKEDERRKKEEMEREERLTREEKIINKLSDQIQLTQNVADQIRNTGERIVNTSQTAKMILQQNLERVDYFELELFIELNPLAVLDKDGHTVLPKDLAEAVRKDRAKEEELDVDLFDPVVEVMTGHSIVIRGNLLEGPIDAGIHG